MTLPRPAVWLLLALPVGAFIGLLYAYAINVPWYDDIETFVGFFAKYKQAQTLSDKLYWLLKPNNEHRVFFGKTVAIAIAALTGELNFRAVMLVGGVCLLGTLTVLFRVFRWQRAMPLALFLPIPFILLQPQFHLASLWTITSMQHIGASFFVISSLYALSAARSTGRFWAAVGLQTLAALSMSNGLFGWVAGAGVLLAQQRYGKLGVWLLITVVVFWFYFHDFSSPQGNESSISFFLKHPHLVFFGFFTFVGGLFDFLPTQPILIRSLLPTLAGFGIIGGTAWLVWQQGWHQPDAAGHASGPILPAQAQQRQRYFWLGAYGYLLVNAAAIGFLRPRFGYEVMLISNYMLYPALWVSLLYLHWISEQRASARSRSLAIGLGGAILVWLVSYNLHWPVLHERRQRLLAFAFNQRHNDAGLSGTLGTPLAEYIDKNMRLVTEQGYYHYPPANPALPDSLLTRPAASFAPFLSPTVSITPQPDRYQIELLPTEPLSARDPAFLLLQSDAHTYLITSQTPLRIASFALNRPVVAIKAEALKGTFYPGTYRLGWATLSKGKPVVRYTEQVVALK